MISISEIRRQINTRRLKLTLVVVFSVSGLGFFVQETLDSIILGMFLLILSSVGVAGEIADFISNIACSFYSQPPVPRLSHRTAGDTARSKENWSDALKAYRLYAAAHPENQDIRFEIAQLYHQELQDKQSAYVWYDSVIQFNRRNTLEALCLLYKIQISCEQGLVERGLNLSKQMHQAFPTHACTKAGLEIVNAYASGTSSLLRETGPLTASA